MSAADEPGAHVRVELRGISVYGHHGVTEAEREVGQRIEIDLVLELAAPAAVHTDELSGTPSTTPEACDIAVTAATETSYRTLERLGAGDRRAARRAPWRRGRDRARRQARAADSTMSPAPPSVEVTARRAEMSERIGYLGLGSNVGDSGGEPPRRDRCAPPQRGGGRGGLLVSVRDRAGRRGPRPARLPERGDPDQHGPRTGGAARRLQGRRGRARPRAQAAPATVPAPIDVDVLLLGDIELETDRLTLPAPGGAPRAASSSSRCSSSTRSSRCRTGRGWRMRGTGWRASG